MQRTNERQNAKEKEVIFIYTAPPDPSIFTDNGIIVTKGWVWTGSMECDPNDWDWLKRYKKRQKRKKGINRDIIKCSFACSKNHKHTD